MPFYRYARPASGRLASAWGGELPHRPPVNGVGQKLAPLQLLRACIALAAVADCAVSDFTVAQHTSQVVGRRGVRCCSRAPRTVKSGTQAHSDRQACFRWILSLVRAPDQPSSEPRKRCPEPAGIFSPATTPSFASNWAGGAGGRRCQQRQPIRTIWLPPSPRPLLPPAAC